MKSKQIEIKKRTDKELKAYRDGFNACYQAMRGCLDIRSKEILKYIDSYSDSMNDVIETILNANNE